MLINIIYLQNSVNFMQNIAIFDLDKTLISVDCSDEWITYLCKKNFIKNSKKTMEVKAFYETLYNKEYGTEKRSKK